MNVIKRSKFYLLTAIIIVIMLSIGLSFCVWDTSSLKSSSTGSTALFGDKYALGYDANSNNVADVGDTIWFGSYFQNVSEDKITLEWRVVDIRVENSKNVMYLLSEKILALGSFWGSESYYDSKGNLIASSKNNQRYNDSTIRAWLNSLARTDGGINFNGNNEGRRIFNGFYNEAFTTVQKNQIIGRTISGMSGSYYGDTTPATPEAYATLTNEKVWLPSFTEVYGVNYGYQKGEKISWNDNPKDIQLSYFKGVININEKSNPILESKVTAYAVSGFANYTNINATHAKNHREMAVGEPNWWRLRSPNKELVSVTSHANTDGSPSGTQTWHNQGGVRPAICLER